MGLSSSYSRVIKMYINSVLSSVISGSKLHIKISYQTSSTASAAQWLTPEQTAGKKHPYFFTQCQVLHVRPRRPDIPAACTFNICFLPLFPNVSHLVALLLLSKCYAVLCNRPWVARFATQLYKSFKCFKYSNYYNNHKITPLTAVSKLATLLISSWFLHFWQPF